MDSPEKQGKVSIVCKVLPEVEQYQIDGYVQATEIWQFSKKIYQTSR